MASQSDFLVFLDLNTKKEKRKVQITVQDFSTNKPGTTLLFLVSIHFNLGLLFCEISQH